MSDNATDKPAINKMVLYIENGTNSKGSIIVAIIILINDAAARPDMKSDLLVTIINVTNPTIRSRLNPNNPSVISFTAFA